MTGLEIFAAVMTILTGFGRCSKYAKEIHDRIKEKRASAKTAAKRLHRSLHDSELELGSEWHKIEQHYRNVRHRYGSSNQVSDAMLSVESLRSQLSKLSSRSALASSLDLSSHQNLADRSRTLTSELLHQLALQLLATLPTTPLDSSSQTTLVFNGVPTTVAQTPLLSRSQLNLQGACRNALIFRRNDATFDQLTLKVSNAYQDEYTCRHCNASVSEVSARLPNTEEDLIWIGPEGMFKAHCTRDATQADGWTCIWPVKHQSCFGRFNSEMRLLQHMKDYHAIVSSRVDAFRLHWPADLNGLSIEACGFGARISGQQMRKHNFI